MVNFRKNATHGIYNRHKGSESMTISMRVWEEQEYYLMSEWRDEEHHVIDYFDENFVETLYYDVVRGLPGFEKAYERYDYYIKHGVQWFKGLPISPHRDDDEPAVICKKIKYWYKHGKRHRIGGPTEIQDNDKLYRELWHVNDELHRIDGPALTHIHHKTGYKDVWWCIRGNRIPPERIQEIFETHDFPEWPFLTDADKVLMRLALS